MLVALEVYLVFRVREQLADYSFILIIRIVVIGIFTSE